MKVKVFKSKLESINWNRSWVVIILKGVKPIITTTETLHLSNIFPYNYSIRTPSTSR